LAQQTEQLVKSALLFASLGKLDQARKIAQKLIASDNARLIELGKIDINSDNYRAVMTELREIEYLYKR